MPLQVGADESPGSRAEQRPAEQNRGAGWSISGDGSEFGRCRVRHKTRPPAARTSAGRQQETSQRRGGVIRSYRRSFGGLDPAPPAPRAPRRRADPMAPVASARPARPTPSPPRRARSTAPAGCNRAAAHSRPAVRVADHGIDIGQQVGVDRDIGRGCRPRPGRSASRDASRRSRGRRAAAGCRRGSRYNRGRATSLTRVERDRDSRRCSKDCPGRASDDLLLGPGGRAGDAGDRPPPSRHARGSCPRRRAAGAARGATRSPAARRRGAPARPVRSASRRRARPPAPARRRRRASDAPVADQRHERRRGGREKREFERGRAPPADRRASTAASARPPSRPAAGP